ncbi:MAG: hypothetical protein EXQ71_11930 [Acidimicrobiia bacterium]|nr:hypothetical protein [Acidimicrobiia bacterium]
MTGTTTTVGESHRWRSFATGFFGVLAIIGVLASVLAVWSQEVLFKPDSLANAVEQALLEPEVIDAVATYLSKEIAQAIPLDTAIADQLPPALSKLSPLLAGAERVVVQAALERLLTLEVTQNLITAAARRVQPVLARVVQGEPAIAGAAIVDNKVSINLLPVLGMALNSLQGEGFLTRVTVPDLSRDRDPDEQIAALEQSIGRSLPEDFGQLTVIEGDPVTTASGLITQAQAAIAALQQAVEVIVVLTVVALIFTMLLSQRRRRTALILLLGIAGAMAIARVVIYAVLRNVPELADDPGARAAIRSVVTTFSSTLLTSVTIILAVGLVLAGALVVTKRFSPGGPPPEVTETPPSTWRAVIETHRDITAVISFAAAIGIITLMGFSPIALGLAVALGGVGCAVLAMTYTDRPPTKTP